MRTLTLSLKKKWFDMIASGEKKEEYREISPYWIKRLLQCGFLCSVNCVLMGEACRYLKYTSFDTAVFTLGYPKKDDMTRRIAFKIEDIEISEGKEEWGAEAGTVYFVIKLGERLC